jgi:uncharacterized membrane-anchored protein YhcB (DUF1043 family)
VIYSDLLFLVIGICIGIAFMLNRKEHLEQKTFEELDIELRKDLDFYKNLSSSLKNDLAYTKHQLSLERAKHKD